MTTTAVGSRIAGKVLGDYLSSVGKGVLNLATGLGSKVGGLVADIPLVQTIGAGTSEEAAKAIAANALLKRLPISTSMMQQGAQALPGVAKGLGIAGSLYGGYQLLSGLANQADSKTSRSAPFATQQYVPGNVPMTNEQVGEVILNQQRYMQQMQLIQARQMASQPQRQLGVPDLMGAISQTYSY